MIAAMQTYYDGWEISTACWEELPDDWKPGDTITYCASGAAKFDQHFGSPFNWMSKNRQTVPANKELLFTDFRAAHASVTETLKATIDALKIR